MLGSSAGSARDEVDRGDLEPAGIGSIHLMALEL
jgi:hypothetical protein